MRNITKTRIEDERRENEVALFLNKYFYKYIAKDLKRFNNETEEDIKNQLNGIDVIFKYNNYLYKCDEKSAVHYVNCYLKTFGMEVSFISRDGRYMKGWLISVDKDTNSYIFIWIDKCDTDNIQSYEDIHELEMILVKKEKLLKYFSDKGWSCEKLEKKGHRIRNNRNEYRGNLDKDGLCFFYSSGLPEQPINSLIFRENLRKISDINIVWCI